ncbi:ADP-ribosylation factor-like 6 interacting protein 1 [Megachile rotundata]|uniref:ADP-ribosylation factor-like 6 interacting protein 1 n=1 Tax=Megachile rotundata TaxID=143995 RepID=UPI000258DEBB|nr:PREDICTED: ADP-ribosylation factor-like protein 6-interacting protein 1 isoform X2 [Megachile rotundata]
MSDNTGVEREKHMKQLKRQMECWREVILSLNSILLWERFWYPGLIVGITSTIFFLIWLLEPTSLTMISVLLLLLALIDYLVPPMTSFLYPVNSWTGQKEKKLYEICKSWDATILWLQNARVSMLQTRKDRPNVYYAAIITFLVICIWIGSTVNNLLLSYIAVNTILLMPGIRHKGRVISQLCAIIFIYFMAFLVFKISYFY